MEQGDFTLLAKDYIHRTGYSLQVLDVLLTYIRNKLCPQIVVADIGAGTGKLTENLIQLGMKGYAVEPNDAMRAEGMRNIGDKSFVWSKGSGEQTGIASDSVDWVLMASSFHWTDYKLSVPEFYRILKPGGFLTVLWNPRDLDKSEFHESIEQKIHAIVPNLARRSSGAKEYTKDVEEKLIYNNLFSNVIFIEAPHEVIITPDRYIGAWKSVNDIQAQAGHERFQRILDMINEEMSGLKEIIVPYKTRSWTVQSIKK